MSETRLSHVAFLVPSVERSAAALGARGFPVGPTEIWEGEGTREIYVGDRTRTGLLLLMEPVREGAYRRAMAKRGPGLHHVAIDVHDLEGYLAGLAGSGWFLHPKSVETIRKSRTAWLARPGAPTLIEVHGRDTAPAGDPFITGIGLPPTAPLSRLFTALGLDRAFFTFEKDPEIRFGETAISFRDILATESRA